MKKEDVLVFDEAFIRQNEDKLQGSETIKQTVADHAYFTPREAAEIDFTKKQIIPYMVLRHGDKVFCTERLKGGTEARLHNKLSIGIGGHVNPIDEESADIIKTCLKRELREEVGYELSEGEYTFAGIINEYRNEVEKVHVGFVYTVDINDPNKVDVAEKEKLAGSWVTKEFLKSNYDRLEGWSQIVLDKYL